MGILRKGRRTHMGAGILVLMLAVSGCASGEPDTTGVDSAGEPVAGGTLRVAAVGSGEAETLDPTMWLIPTDLIRIGALYDQLVTLDASGQPEWALAESMIPGEDLTSWEISLREGVTFHDGTELSADDVLYTIEYILENEANAAATLAVIDIENSEAVDDLTIALELNQPIGSLPSLFVDPGTSIFKEGTTDFDTPNGTGPFVFESWTRGERSTFSKNEAYWGQQSYVDELQVLSINDETTRLNAVLGGEVDLSFGLSATAISQLESAGLQVGRKTGVAAPNFYLRADKEPTSNPAVRQALQLALDRQQCVDSALLGEGEVASDLFGPNFPSYPDDAEVISYDPDGARAILDEAGLGEITIELEVGPGEAGMMECAQVFKESALAAGIDIQLKTVPAEDVFNPDAGYLSRPFGMTAWGGNSFENVARMAMITGAMFDETGIASEEFDEAFAAADATVDDEERNQQYADLAKQIQQEAVYLIWGYQDVIQGIATDVHGAERFANSPSVGFSHIGLNEIWLEQ